MDGQISITITVGLSLTFGAGGCYGMAKLLQLMERRRHDKASKQIESEEEGAFRPRARDPLFPNGEHDEFVAQINALRVQNLQRRKENGITRVDQQATRETLEELKVAVTEISARLERAGI